MDTLTHALSGALLARALTPSSRPDASTASRAALRWLGPPLSTTQAVLIGAASATFPDLDFVLGWVSELAYLRGHRGVTHSLLIWPVWSIVIGVVFALLVRRPPLWKRASWIAAAGVGIHIVGDFITQFGTMLLAPLSDARFGLGSTFIIDLAITGIVVAGLAASAVWRSSRVPAAVALALLPAWIAVSLMGRAEALAFARAHAQQERIAAQFVDAAPRPASPFNWTVVIFDGTTYRYAHINTRRTKPLVARPDDHLIRRFSAPYLPLDQARWQTLPMHGTAMDEALAKQAWAHPEFGFFRWFAQFPAVERIERRTDGDCVWYIDLRFLTPGRAEIPFRYGMCRLPGNAWKAFRLDADDRRVHIQ